MAVRRIGSNPLAQEILIEALRPVHRVPRPNVPRDHLKTLQEKIAQQGYDLKRPVAAIALPHGDLIIGGGHHRHEVMKRLRETTIPTVIYRWDQQDLASYVGWMLLIGKHTGYYRHPFTEIFLKSLSPRERAEAQETFDAWRLSTGF